MELAHSPCVVISHDGLRQEILSAYEKGTSRSKDPGAYPDAQRFARLLITCEYPGGADLDAAELAGAGADGGADRVKA